MSRKVCTRVIHVELIKVGNVPRCRIRANSVNGADVGETNTPENSMTHGEDQTKPAANIFHH